MSDLPTIGRIVHYADPENSDGRYPIAVYPALVTDVLTNGNVSLCVFRTTGFEFVQDVELARNLPPDAGSMGCWFWPPRI